SRGVKWRGRTADARSRERCAWQLRTHRVQAPAVGCIAKSMQHRQIVHRRKGACGVILAGVFFENLVCRAPEPFALMLRQNAQMDPGQNRMLYTADPNSM